MRITVGRHDLGAALATNVAAERSHLPSLSSALIEADAERGKVSITTTDLDTTITTDLAASVESSGAVAIRVHDLLRLLAALPDKSVAVASLGGRVEIGCEGAVFQFPGIDKEQFPKAPGLDHSKAPTFKAGMLAKMARAVAFATSTDDSRPILHNVLWELREGRTGMVGTNGHKLAHVAADIEGLEDVDLMVPAAALRRVAQLFPPKDELSVARNEKHIEFRANGRRILTRLAEGPFPNWRQVLPNDADRVAVMERERLEGVARRMSVVISRPHSERLHLTFGSDQKLAITVAGGAAKEGRESLPIEYEGEPMEIGFNVEYVLDILNHIPTSKVRFRMKGKHRAAFIEPVGGGVDAEDYFFLLMPMRLLD